MDNQNRVLPVPMKISPAEIDREYKYFIRNCNSIPNYITKNLHDMPNNKGYIYKGIYLFGELEAEKNKPMVLFEKQGKDLLVIHEWTKNGYKKFEKHGKDRKKMVEHTKKKKTK